jgi:hypothetical protein
MQSLLCLWLSTDQPNEPSVPPTLANLDGFAFCLEQWNKLRV